MNGRTQNPTCVSFGKAIKSRTVCAFYLACPHSFMNATNDIDRTFPSVACVSVCPSVTRCAVDTERAGHLGRSLAIARISCSLTYADITTFHK